MICYLHVVSYWDFHVSSVHDTDTIIPISVIGKDIHDELMVNCFLRIDLEPGKIQALNVKKIPTNVSNVICVRYKTVPIDDIVTVVEVAIEQNPPEEDH